MARHGDGIRQYRCGRFVENHGAALSMRRCSRARRAFTHCVREEIPTKRNSSLEGRRRKRSEQCRPGREWARRDVVANGQSDQAMAGITDQGHTRIADERDGSAVFHGQDEFGGAGELVVFVIADQRLGECT